MKHYYHLSCAAGILILIIGAVFALSMAVVALFLTPKGRVSCDDFGAYQDACDAARNYAPYLDGEGDGYICESRFPNKPRCL